MYTKLIMEKTLSTNKSSSRVIARDAVLASIRDKALALIDEQGFGNVTVKDIADEAGISERTFFRYFNTKEDVILSDPFPIGYRLQDELSKQPAGESAWKSLEKTFLTLKDIYEVDDRTALRLHRLSQSSPELRAKAMEKQCAWIEQLTPEVSKRLSTHSSDKDIAAEVLVQAAIVCLNVAVKKWSKSDGKIELSKLIEKSFGSFTYK